MIDHQLDIVTDKIQGKVFRDIKEVFADKGFDCWRKPEFCGLFPEKRNVG